MSEHLYSRAPHNDTTWSWCPLCTANGVTPDTITKGKPPSREGLEDHQVWVWMNVPGIPHYEIRGTGIVFDLYDDLGEEWK